MIVLNILREHPLVHVVDIDVVVLADGTVMEAGSGELTPRGTSLPKGVLAIGAEKDSSAKVLERMTLPMLAYGDKTVPDKLEWPVNHQRVPPDMGFMLWDIGVDGFYKKWGDDGQSHYEAAYKDPHTHWIWKHVAFFRRDYAHPGVWPGWRHHLFMPEDTTTVEAREQGEAWGWCQPFWMYPPVAELRPWREAVDAEMWKRGYRKDVWVKPKVKKPVGTP